MTAAPSTADVRDAPPAADALPGTEAAEETVALATRPRRSVLSTVASSVALVTVVGGLAGGWLWLRDSSLVTVERVTVIGARGPQARAVRRAIVRAGRRMTTLHVRRSDLTAAVEPYPIVRALGVDTDFPHRLRVTVHQYVPVGAILAGKTRIPVAADGTLLHHTPVRGIPAIQVGRAPAGHRLADRRGLQAVRLVAAAPRLLRVHLARAYVGPQGLTATIEGGPVLYFGPGSRLAAKWAAVVRVLAEPSSQGASYLDVRVPERPAAGGLEPTAEAAPGAEGTVPAQVAPSPSPPPAPAAAPIGPAGGAGGTRVDH